MLKTINQIKKEFEEIANTHRFINHFFFGNFLDLYESHQIQHTALIVDINQGAPGRGANNGNYYNDLTVQITVCDKVYDDKRDYADVKSDTYQIINDIRNILESHRWRQFSTVASNPSATFFQQRGGDVVDGWTVTVILRIADLRNLCAIPLVGYDFDTELAPMCAAATVLLNGAPYGEVESGATIDVISPVGGVVDLSINGTLFDTYTAPATPDVAVRNTAGTNLGSKVGANWEIADITLTDTDASASSKVAGINLSCTLITALSCAQLNNATTGLTITQRQLLQTVKDLKTGQTTSYRTGDDGDLEHGRGSSFTVLDCNNPFGNTNRFTDELGTQIYTNNLVVDWLTGLMWYRLPIAGDWNTAIDGAVASTQGGHTDWVIPNRNEAIGISYMGVVGHLNYSPFNINIANSGEKIWTSTTAIKNTATAYSLSDTNDQIEAYPKASTLQYLYCRYFTMADLGL